MTEPKIAMAPYLESGELLLTHVVHVGGITNTVRIDLPDFSDSTGATWEMLASHQEAGGTTTWTRATDHCGYSFPITDPGIDVDLTATDSTGATKTRRIRIKVLPPLAKPDGL